MNVFSYLKFVLAVVALVEGLSVERLSRPHLSFIPSSSSETRGPVLAGLIPTYVRQGAALKALHQITAISTYLIYIFGSQTIQRVQQA